MLNVRVSNNFSDIVGKGPGDKAVWRDTAAKMSLIVDIREFKQLYDDDHNDDFKKQKV